MADGAIRSFGAWYGRRVERRQGIDGRLDRALRWGARKYAWLELPKHVALLVDGVVGLAPANRKVIQVSRLTGPKQPGNIDTGIGSAPNDV